MADINKLWGQTVERISGTPQHELPLFPDDPESRRATESYAASDGCIVRQVRLRNGTCVTSDIGGRPSRLDADPHASFDSAWLRSTAKPRYADSRGSVRLVDLFSGCGALSLGVTEACRALGLAAEHVLAADIDRTALAVYAANFHTKVTCPDPVESLVGQVGTHLSSTERALKKSIGSIDILAGGPPCQGHSDLNNHTRRRDPKNALFSAMVRFAQVLEPKHIIIENVPGIRHDKGSVVEAGRRVLEAMGYGVHESLVLASEFGVAQRRRRYLMVASRLNFEFEALTKVDQERTARWACEDLAKHDSSAMLDSHAASSRENKKRIQYLFDNNLYDLPDDVRPPCHRNKKHSYKAVYGRLRWDEPAPTITSGFNSPGQGRFIHPDIPRTLTPHEAARLQFLPDFFIWGTAKREALTQMIGNAVPPKLAYAIALELLR